MAQPPSNPLPQFHLLCMEERFSQAFSEAVQTHFPRLLEITNIQIHNCSLQQLDRELHIDAVVSPANSYARLDGAFDDALARAYGPAEDYDWITRLAQKVVYKKWKGFAPPGTCTVIDLNTGSGTSDGSQAAIAHPWDTRYLLLCPTMAVPVDVQWDRQVVYECVWSLLCAVDDHNQELASQTQGTTAENDRQIKSILMTPLATGIGRVRPQRWAEQCVLAIKHWVEATEKPEVWGNLSWEDVYERQDDVEATFIDDVPGPPALVR